MIGCNYLDSDRDRAQLERLCRQGRGLRSRASGSSYSPTVRESVGIACGLFIASLQAMGLCTLTHTPSPMEFLTEILGRPRNERPYILFPIGYAADDATVPDLQRKSLDDVCVWNP